MDESDRLKIAALEGQLVSEKPWQLKGEVSARSRPLNSLLFEDIKFDKTIKAPEITPEFTLSLEDVIKQRIKENQFDDPVRKVKPSVAAIGAREVEVSAEKSKVGLAQLYEQELIDKVTGGRGKDGPEKEVERKLVALCKKLDALVEK